MIQVLDHLPSFLDASCNPDINFGTSIIVNCFRTVIFSTLIRIDMPSSRSPFGILLFGIPSRRQLGFTLL